MRKLGASAAATLALIVAAILVSGCGNSSSSSSTTASTAATTAATSSTPAATSSTPAATSSTPAASSGAPQVLKLAADPGGALSFSTTSLTAKAGKVTIEFTNSSPVPHNLTIGGGASGATPTFAGGTKSLTLDLKAGSYKFFCSVPGHAQAGMQGTLTVN